MSEESKKPVNIRLDTSLYQVINGMAQAQRRSFSAMAIILLEEGLSKVHQLPTTRGVLTREN